MNTLKRATPFLLLLFILTIVFPLLFSKTHITNTPKKHLHFQNHMQVAKSTCEGTLYPHLCVSTIVTFPDLTSKSVPQIISSMVNHTVNEVKSSSYNCSSLKKKLKNLKPREHRALDDCLKLFDDTTLELKTTIADLSKTTIGSKQYHDLQTLLSGAMTNLYTCLDGFAYTKGNVRNRFQKKLLQISHHVSNSLALLKKVPGVKRESKSEVFPEYGKMKHGFPSWVSSKDRKLLQASVNVTKFDLVVAKDGTGNFTTIGEAVDAAPNSSTTRFVIHIKAGAYFENVEVIRKKSNLMFIGDGIGKTVVKASRNVVDGWTTFQSATVDGMAPRNKMAALKALAVSAAEKALPKETGTTSKVGAQSPAVKTLKAQPISTVLAEDAGAEDDEPLSLRKRRKVEGRLPPRSGAQDRAKAVVDLSERSDVPARKSKSGKKHKTAPFDPKEFMNTKAEAFKADPFRVSLSVFARMTDLVEAQKKDADLKLKDVESKYEEAKKALEPLRNELEKSEKVVEQSKKEKEEWESKKKELEDELQKANKQAEKDAAELKKRDDIIAELKASISSQDVSELKRQIEDLTNQRDQAVELGREGISEAFINALDQVAIVVPTFVADPELFKPEYSVHDGHIVEFDPVTDEIARVIYPAKTG